MVIGFDSGSTWWDKYQEAKYEIRRCYWNSIGQPQYVSEHLRPEAEEAAEFYEGLYENEYYERFHQKSMTELIKSTDWSIYYECSPNEVFEKWGFNLKDSDISGEDDLISTLIDAPKEYIKKYADKITGFNPKADVLGIDAQSFGVEGSSATYKAGKNKRRVKKKLARKDYDFLYDKSKGHLYFNENGSDKGFGDGGVIAILKGAPDLRVDNIDFL